MKRFFVIGLAVVGALFVLPRVSRAATISSMSPTAILPGDVLTINGSGFGSLDGYVCFTPSYKCQFTFNDGSQNTWSDSVIAVVVPSGISEGAISVHNFYPSSFDLAGPSYVGRIPVIDSVSKYVVSDGDEVTMTGANFGKSGTVYFKNPDCYSWNQFQTIVSWSDTTIVFKVKCWLTSTVDISNQIKSSSITLQGKPEVAKINETVLYPGGLATITGKRFGQIQGRVFFGDQQATVSSWADTAIAVRVPALSFASYVATIQSPVKVVARNVNSGIDDVESNVLISRVYRTISNDPFSMLQTYLSVLGIPESWDASSNKKIVVAVIDDGVYINHPELRNEIWINSDEVIGNGRDDDRNGYVDDIYGWDFYHGNGEMTTHGSHGTMVAGIIAAARNNSDGIAGINPNASIMPLIVCGSTCGHKDIVQAIYYAVDNGANVINLSLGSSATTGYTNYFDEAMKYANSHGVVVVAAAGNGDTEGGIGQDLRIIPQSPVCNDVGRNAVIGVGAVNDDRYLLSWSNFGNCVDVYAPGEAIVSTAVPASSSLGGFYDVESGTSFAAPMITGLVSLVQQQYPSMPPSEVIARIYRHSTNGIIDAIGFVQESYIPVISPEVLGEETAAPTISKITLKNGATTIWVGKRHVSLKPFQADYRGEILARKINFNDRGKVFLFVPLHGYRNGELVLFNDRGKAISRKRPFNKFSVNGLNADIIVEPSSNRVFLAIGERNNGKRVQMYEVTSSGLRSLNIVNVSNAKAGNILAKFKSVYQNGFGLVTFLFNEPKSVKVWYFDSSQRKFIQDRRFGPKDFRLKGDKVSMK